MSYDVHLIKLKPGLSTEEARQQVEAAIKHWEQSTDEYGFPLDEDDDDELDDWFASIADSSFTEERMREVLHKTWLRIHIPDSQQTDAMKSWFDSHRYDPALPEDFYKYYGLFDVGITEEWEPGVLACHYGWSDEGTEALRKFYQFAKEVAPLGFVVFDGQGPGLIDPNEYPYFVDSLPAPPPEEK